MKSFSWVICYFIIVMFYSIHSMEKFSKEDEAWKIILQHGMSLFDYAMVRSLAVSRHLHTILRETAEDRKKYVQKYACRLSCHVYEQYDEWRAYGAVSGNVIIAAGKSMTGEPIKYIMLERNCLSNPMRLSYYGSSDYFYGTLPHQPPPFFNKQGDFCFYGYAGILNSLYKRRGIIAEYSLSIDGMYKIMECVTSVKDRILGIQVFLEFPYLLEAFLKSDRVYQELDCNDTVVKVFAIKGVTIPANYATHKQYFSSTRYKSFDALSHKDIYELLCRKIVRQYTSQCVKKWAKRKKRNLKSLVGK